MELDETYAVGIFIPDADSFPPRWASRAEEFRAALGERARIGVPYGENPREKYDLFLPQSNPAGTVVFIHGGYWRAYDKSSWSHLAAGPLARGWAVAMPSYDLCPDIRISGITRQMKSAVEAIAGVTTGPLSITGHSAGGHLSARLLDRALLGPGTAERLKSVVPISPLSDLRPLIQTTMNEDFKMNEDMAVAESPLFMTDRYTSAVTVLVGADERPAFLDQARWLSDAWDCDLVIAPDRHHFDVIDALGDPKSDLVGRLVT